MGEIDRAKSKDLLTKAADHGDEAAVSMLKQLSKESDSDVGGEKFSADPVFERFEHWAQAAAEGDPAAQFNLGLAYLRGDGIEKDQKKGIELWKMAAEQGDEMAQRNLIA